MKADVIADIAKRRGFFWQSSAVHGAISGFYDYGHIGCLVKRRFENLWRDYFLTLDDNFYEIQTSVIMPEEVFKASGHLENFVDPIVKCSKCGFVTRADHIVERELKESFEGASPEQLTELIKKHKIVCEKCKGPYEEAAVFNMLFPLKLGVGKGARTGYLTGETAQGAYVNFKFEFEALRKRLPMGLAIIGKAFRNEISPRNMLIRLREFTQAELQIFFDADFIDDHPRFTEVEKYKLRLHTVSQRAAKTVEEISCKEAVSKLGLPKFYVYHMAKVQQFYLETLKLQREKFRFKQLSDEEKAFYNKYHWDVELDLESLGGFKEVAGIHYRTDHDLVGHQNVSKESMVVNIEGKRVLPHVLELSFGVDRNIYALFELAYEEEKERTVLRFPRLVAPYDAAVFPLVNKDGLPEIAREVQALLKDRGLIVFFDHSGSIGRRYRRMDEIGTAAGITVDYDSKVHKDVTLRDRDSMKQVRVKIKDLPDVLKRFWMGEALESLGAKFTPKTVEE